MAHRREQKQRLRRERQERERAAGCTVRELGSEGRQHVEGQVSYRSNPPHSGNHNQVPADDGAYAEPTEDENLVHALEHGRVVYWFNPGAPARIKGDLKALFDEDDYHVLLAPSERRMPYTFCSLPERWFSRAGTVLLSAAVSRGFAGDFLAPERTPWHDCGRSHRRRFQGGLTTQVALRECCTVDDGIVPSAAAASNRPRGGGV